jgi:hypothetical protein
MVCAAIASIPTTPTSGNAIPVRIAEMKLSELIAAIGDENVGIQPLDVCADSLDWSAKKGTKITFVSDQPITPNGTVKLGLVIWMDRDAVDAEMAKAKAA